MISNCFHSRKLMRVIVALLCLGLGVACAPAGGTYAPVATMAPATVPNAPAATMAPAAPLLAAQVLHMTVYPVYATRDQLPVLYRAIAYPVVIEEKLSNNSARIVELPDAKAQVQLQTALVNKSKDLSLARFNPDLYAFNRPAVSADLEYIAVPVNTVPEFDFMKKGVNAGVLYANNGFYGKEDFIYNVWLFENRAELRDDNGDVLYTAFDGKEYSLIELPQPVDVPMVTFVQNGCWCCWSIDSRNGCLICTR